MPGPVRTLHLCAGTVFLFRSERAPPHATRVEAFGTRRGSRQYRYRGTSAVAVLRVSNRASSVGFADKKRKAEFVIATPSVEFSNNERNWAAPSSTAISYSSAKADSRMIFTVEASASLYPSEPPNESGSTIARACMPAFVRG